MKNITVTPANIPAQMRRAFPSARILGADIAAHANTYQMLVASPNRVQAVPSFEWSDWSANDRGVESVQGFDDPDYSSDYAPYGQGTSAVRFEGTQVLYGGNDHPTGDFSRAIVFKTDDDETGAVDIVRSVDGNSNIHRLQYDGSTNNLEFRVGTSGGSAAICDATVPDGWVMAVMSWDSTNKTVTLGLDDGQRVSDTNIGAAIVNQNWYIGGNQNAAEFSGDISAVITMNIDVFAQGNEGVLKMLWEYSRGLATG